MEIGAGNVPMETPGRLHRKSLPGGRLGGGDGRTHRESCGLFSDMKKEVKTQSERDQLGEAGELEISTSAMSTR